MANTLKCKDCKHYDPITPPKGRVGSHGWCVKRSKYPFKEGPGQTFPDGAQRVASAETPAKPYIVTNTGVVASCLTATPKVTR